MNPRTSAPAGWRRSPAILLASTALALLVAACTSAGPSGALENVPSPAQSIMSRAPYRTARWLWNVTDLKGGATLTSRNSGQLVPTGSTGKLFTVGTAYAVLGTPTQLTTPVYAVGTVQDGVLQGNAVLVASGDLALGGRGAMQGRMEDSDTKTTTDQVYADIAPNGAPAPGDPLAGLDSLAHQVADAGIHRIDGDVVIDTRLWQTFQGGEGPVTPIYVNDNLLGLTVTPARGIGQVATVAESPQTAAYAALSTVRTVAGSGSAIKIAASSTNPRQIVITGTVGVEARPAFTVYRVPDPASWARTLFIEALERAGVTVTAPALAANDESELPAGYSARTRVASLKSPTLAAMGSMILRTSYNTGAEDLLCLLAAHLHSTDCTDGLKLVEKELEKAGLDVNDVVLANGEGAYPSAATPVQMTRWLAWTQTQPWGAALRAGLPVLGESGALAQVDTPVTRSSTGELAAKTGSVAAVDPSNGRVSFTVEALAGFMSLGGGRTAAFDVSMSGATYPDVLTGLVQSQNDVSGVSAALRVALAT